MPNAQLPLLNIPQSTIRVKVDYYSQAEKAKLLGYPTSTEIEALVADGIEIPTGEFLTYYLFHRKRPGKAGWQDYDQISIKIGRALAYLGEWVDFNGVSISCPADVNHPGRDIVEHVGESIGMSVVGRLHGLTVIDWDSIQEQQGIQTFDYQMASDGKRVVQVESKGSSTTDNSIITPTVRSHRHNIAHKKLTINQSQGYPYPADLRYGTIAVLGQNPKVPVRCLLVDPEPEGSEERARKLRVVQRMRFLRDWIAFLSPRSQLASALSTRLASLEELEDPFQLDGIALRKGNGGLFDYGAEGFSVRGHSPFFANKSRVTDGPAGGVTLQLPDGNLFFLGIREDVLELAASQQLGALLEFKTPRTSTFKQVDCLFSEGRMRSLPAPQLVRERAQRQRGYYSIRVRGMIHYADSGILFGVLPIR